MNRRTFVVSVGAVLGAGCLGQLSPGAASGDDPNTGNDHQPTDDGNGPEPGSTEPDGGLPTDGGDGSRPADGVEPPADPPEFGECPTFDPRADASYCVADGASGASAVLTSDGWTLAADEAEPLTLTLTNEGSADVTLNPYAWSLHRQTDDGWERVAPDAYIEPLFTLSTNDTWEWVLGGSTPSDGEGRKENVIHVDHDFEPGTYAFAVTVNVPGEKGGPRRVEWVARFRVEA